MWQAQQLATIQMANQILYAMSAPSNYTLNQRPPHLAYEDNVGDATDEEDDEQLRTLYIGNLDDRVTEDLLFEVFLQAGPIESVRIPKDNNGRQRSFGFLVYTHRSTPSYATKLFAGLTLYRKCLVIKLQLESHRIESHGGNKRRSLPSDCERYISRPNDNTMLRSNSYTNFFDTSINDHNRPSSPMSNPFRTSSPDYGNGVGGRGANRDRERDRKMDRDRGNSHVRAHPYKRDDRRQRDEGQLRGSRR